MSLTVAVTGPTGTFGFGLIPLLQDDDRIGRIVGIARRPFDPAERGWTKMEYRRGDVRDPDALHEAFAGADVVVHLAFSLMGEGERTRAINVDGSRNVFEAAVAAGAERICYASSVAAYGFHEDNPMWLTEETPARGTPEHFYSGQKAEVERVLAETLQRRRKTVAYVFRPCIVAGPRAQMLLEELPYFRLSDAMPDAVAGLLASMPMLKPVIPDAGLRFQLVHEEDVAAAFLAGVQGKGEPGPYNLAGSGTLTMSDLAAELGWYSVRVPELAVDAAAEVVSRLPRAPESVSWIHAARKPVLMKVARAAQQLGWKPRHTSRATLRELVAARRDGVAALR